ncbi:hypothetical protein HMPREF0518_1548 [Lactobacillus helveticus DSM 20075 = CGMCC 1.1877]|nr:hypothetical protein HMPREF0518_1548 [Lactobacillus helveticus DSM 20075 = CGMCC 1.1877]
MKLQRRKSLGLFSLKGIEGSYMRKDFKENLLNILNGVSTGVVIALVPGALVNELMKNIAHSWSGAQNILTMTSLMGSLLAVFAGIVRVIFA